MGNPGPRHALRACLGEKQNPRGQRGQIESSAESLAGLEVVRFHHELVDAPVYLHDVKLSRDAPKELRNLLASFTLASAREDDHGTTMHNAAEQSIRDIRQMPLVEDIVEAQASCPQGLFQVLSDARLVKGEGKGLLRRRNVNGDTHAKILAGSGHVRAPDGDLRGDAVQLLAEPEHDRRLSLAPPFPKRFPVCGMLSAPLSDNLCMYHEILCALLVAPVSCLNENCGVVAPAADPVQYKCLDPPDVSAAIHQAANLGFDADGAAPLPLVQGGSPHGAVEGLKPRCGAASERVDLRYQSDVLQDHFHHRHVRSCGQSLVAEQRKLVKRLYKAIQVNVPCRSDRVFCCCASPFHKLSSEGQVDLRCSLWLVHIWEELHLAGKLGPLGTVYAVRLRVPATQYGVGLRQNHLERYAREEIHALHV
eukprot:scaffold7095_cov260-Pinguiococcus_pyrenoidosus.AAC.1